MVKIAEFLGEGMCWCRAIEVVRMLGLRGYDIVVALLEKMMNRREGVSIDLRVLSTRQVL